MTPSPGPRPRLQSSPVIRSTPARTVFAALLAAALLPSAIVLADIQAVAESSYEDKTVGYSIRPIRGWEARPRKNPDDPIERVIAGGWYLKPGSGPREETEGVECLVLRFGTFFGDEDRTVATGPAPAPPAPPGDGEDGKGKGEGEAGGDEKGDGKDEGGKDEGGKDGGGKPEGQGGKAPPPPPRTVKELFGKGPASFDEWRAAWSKNLRARGLFSELDGKPAKFGSDEGQLWEGTIARGRGSSR